MSEAALHEPYAPGRFAARSAHRRALPIRLVGVICFCTLWRLPMFFDPPWLNDEGTYATVGAAIFRGEALYRQVWENKPPAIYLLYGSVDRLAGAAHLLVGVRALALLAAVTLQAAIYALVRAQRGTETALLAAAIAGLLVDLPLLDGTTANAEIFVAAGTSTGMALLWLGMGRASWRARDGTLLLAGAAFGLAVLFKLVAGADVLAAVGLVVAWRSPPNLRQRALALACLGAGVAIPLVACTLWLASRGLLADALYATVTYNRSYVATGQTQHALVIEALSIAGPLVLVLAALALFRRASWRLTAEAAACWWLALALAGALASGRTYPHYFLQAVPPVAQAAALAFDALATRWAARRTNARAGGAIHAASAALQRRSLVALLAAWACLIPFVSWVAVRGEPPHPSPGSDLVGYYGHFWQYVTGALDATAYGNALDPRVERNVATATYLREHPPPSRRLYVWGNAPWIYYLSGYEHAARFLSAAYRPPIPGGAAQVLHALVARPPPYIVVIEPPTPPSAPLEGFIRAHYHPVWRYRGAVIYLAASTPVVLLY